MKEVLLYEALEDSKTRCKTCAHNCLIVPGKRGICGVRENRNGKLYALNYGKIVAENVDPIEKKPLFHFLPGSTSYSIATVGCNFRCLFCQNADISQMPRETNIIYGKEKLPEEILKEAVIHKCASISYTYTEPTIFLEYALDIMKPAKIKRIANVFVSNGFMSPEACDELIPVLDAANIDLKSFREEFYRDLCGARLSPVLDAIAKLKKAGVWIEITTLIIPGQNDDPAELRDIARFIVSIGKETPWHVTRFHPAYRMLSAPITPVATLVQAREIGLKEGLEFVYTGNVPGEKGESTYCPSCKALLIERFGFRSNIINLDHGHCGKCGKPIAGVWKF
ncbi:MAG: AmmeMemoRadiSam system radical SAM enzyme [Syntrophobacterales bacterium]|nr:AmmeMemoRadiSam system radical SAM enzyme [Syntrophobacterales bacterium]